jgi:tetrahydromethanopterin S-methyltransferase subunit G
MNQTILVVVLPSAFALVGTLLSSKIGANAANSVTVHRIDQLEKKVEKHNNLVERMVAVEASTKSAHKRIDDIGKE